MLAHRSASEYRCQEYTDTIRIEEQGDATERRQHDRYQAYDRSFGDPRSSERHMSEQGVCRRRVVCVFVMPMPMMIIRILLAEVAIKHHRHQIRDIEQGRDHQYGDENHLIRLGSGQRQIPLRPHATQWWQTDDRQRSNKETEERYRHFTAKAAHVRYFGLVGKHDDRTGTEEQGDLAKGVHDDVQRRAERSGVGCQHGAQHNVAELRDLE